MKKTLLSLILVAGSMLLGAQTDLNYTITAKIDGVETALDSLVIENQTNGERAVVKNLPAETNIITILTGADHVNSILSDINSEFTLTQIRPGTYALAYTGTTLTDANVTVYNLEGQFCTRQNLSLQTASSVEIAVQRVGVYIVTVQPKTGKPVSFKVLGTMGDGSIKIGEVCTIGTSQYGTQTDNSEFRYNTISKAPSQTFKVTLKYKTGDQLKLTAWKADHHASSETITIDGDAALNFTLEPVVYKMLLTTTKAVGEKIELRINAEAADRPDVWIDLNNDGIKDEGEAVTTFDSNVEYPLGAQTVTIYGDVTHLNCSSNELIALDVSKNTNLTYLNVASNQIATLDVSKNTKLTGLYCSGNKLTELDVSNNTKLTRLGCDENQLTVLNISNNPELTTLYCNDNQLTSLDVSNNKELEILYCFNNKISGDNMTTLVNSLPDRTGKDAGTFRVIFPSSTTEQNAITTGQAKIAADKNWSLLDANGNPYTPTQSKMVLTTTKAVGEKIKLWIDTEVADRSDVWIDLNNNGTKDEGEAVTTFRNYVEYILGAQTITIYGKVTTLYCKENQLTNIDVSKNTELKTLDCYENQLTTLDVSKNTNLTYLYVDANQIATLDMSKNTKLEHLSCHNNKISGDNMTTLVNSLPDRNDKDAGKFYAIYPNSTTEQNGITTAQAKIATDKNWSLLDANGNPYTPTQSKMVLTTTKAVGEKIKLRINAEAADRPDVWIDLNNNGNKDDGEAVTTFYSYVEYTLGAQTITIYGDVTTLYCNDNKLTALDVSKNTKLTDLYCNNNQISELDVSKNTKLTDLYCNNNQISELDVSKNTELETLDCYENQLSNLDVSNNTKLIRLDFAHNQLTNLDVSKNTELTELNCYKNQLIALDVSKNTKLIDLKCENNPISELDVSNNTELKYLWCNYTQLSTLDVSNNTKLDQLSCNYSQLTALDVSKNTNLTYLEVDANQIATLDVSNNTKLTRLYCGRNKLTVLDVSNNTKLTTLSCYENQLAVLNTSNNLELATLYCNDNQLTSLDVSNNKGLECLVCYNNKISGENMTTLVNSLPDRKDKDAGKFYAIYPSSTTEQNAITTAQANIAADKNWSLLDASGNPYP